MPMKNLKAKKNKPGRRLNSDPYKEQTVQVRVPKSMLPKVNKMLDDFKHNLK